uniref:C3H1-type domain-containing protein n=1 Tax=Panagrolaimus superbus TaxID=310955 RepID=A0A914Y2M5_9BILA
MEKISDLTQYINPVIHNVHSTAVETSDKKHSDTYKTVMCLQWLSSSTCTFGADCKFAHGEAELRPGKLPIRNTLKYKTKLCDQYTTTGVCPYGSRCLFIHPNSSYYRQSSIAQKLMQHSLGFQSSKPPKSPSAPTFKTSPYVTPTPSLAPSPPKSCSQFYPALSRPHTSWPLQNNSIFIDESYKQNESLNHSRSLPNSLPTTRHSSVSYSQEAPDSTSGAWTLF